MSFRTAKSSDVPFPWTADPVLSRWTHPVPRRYAVRYAVAFGWANRRLSRWVERLNRQVAAGVTKSQHLIRATSTLVLPMGSLRSELVAW